MIFRNLSLLYFIGFCINVFVTTANADSTNLTQLSNMNRSLRSSNNECNFYLQDSFQRQKQSSESMDLMYELEKHLDGISVIIDLNQHSKKLNTNELVEYFRIHSKYLNFILQKLNVKVLRLGHKPFNRLEYSEYPTDEELEILEVRLRNIPLLNYFPGLKSYPLDIFGLDGQFLEIQDVLGFRLNGFRNI